MADFNFYLNRQGVRGPQGVQGPQGFSPIITVATDTLSEYILQIQTQNNTFLTSNLREHKEDLGGTYIRYNRETGVMYAGDADMASTSQMGVVRFATATDIEREDETSVVSPADVAGILSDAGFSGDISDLKSDVHDLQLQVATNTQNISDNTSAIGLLQTSVTGLLANYVPKTRTINGHALSSNIILGAADVGAYSKSETDTLLNAKANTSDLPDMNNYYNTTQIDLMLNEKADISDVPTVGNGTITFTQGGVTKGSITTNQSGDATIALDAGSQYTLPPATTSTLGGVIPDGTTITVDSNGVISSVGGGGGGTTYNPGNGISIDSSTNTISAKVDGTTVDVNNSGELKVISAPTPNNMVTTDTTQTITGNKTFSTLTVNTAISAPSVNSSQYYGSGNSMFLDLGSRNVLLANKTSGVEKIVLGNTTDFTNIQDNSNNGIIDKSGNPYLTSANIGTYALTSLPTATTSLLGGVIPDGTTITVDADGTIHGASTYVLPTASTSTLGGVKVDGTSITIDGNGVISSSGGGGGSLPSQTGHDGDVLTTDGTDASWADTEEVRVIIEAYQNGASWYRLYDDNFCEQGGYSATASGTVTVNFLKAFADTNYIILKTMDTSSTNAVQFGHVSFSSRTTTSAQTVTAGVGFSWYACGYIS